MVNLVDFHTHSLISDGSCSPTEVVQAAFKNNVKALSLTDHDSISGILEANIASKKYGINFIPGIEISALYPDGRMLHILGLGMDINNVNFLNPYIKMKKAREESLPITLKYLKYKHNLSIDINILKEKKLDEFISRHDIHKYLIDNNICNNSKLIWNTYLDPIPYGKNELIPIEEAINMINKSGGVSILAHYNNRNGFSNINKSKVEEHIKYLISLGLRGIEKYYPTFNDDDYRFVDYLIKKYKLIPSGGTDFHGSYRPNNDIGIGNGTFAVPYEVFYNIKNY
ncbi:PHP domain-containing protein [Clostridium celatum]|uniref:PHP domain protein n=1 Tax=Clostridium celatum DSM 1785 TaxID=545697 RepID=L1QHY5_9CLOT|nr:PHP domain-containing protein [Clostridium celatum]EKY27546.1 PHP domain protein [Clostridium celatum DSM 1785]MCE9655548.1 PHP domain-containing protein [Clostridium celatum]MDU2265933.1 PHP domain-containing protein [Clostridium celatum]MDU3723852.1 PHP domain-containing protein [Clostridium celatum]MDU6296229.1 PHP domain-containing protein [Clostridium celatum]